MHHKEQQIEEALVIESSFGPHLLSIKTENCWKKWCPLEACIRILPSDEADQVFVSADISFKCNEEYPDKVPSIKVSNSEGLTTSEVNALCDMLKGKAEVLKGQPMILELCMACKDFLESRNKKGESEYEKREKAKEKIENEKKRKRVDSEKKEHAEIQKEDARRKQELERRKKEEERISLAKALNFGEMGEFISIKTCFGEEKTINKKANYVQRRKPHRLCNEWAAFDDRQRELLVSEWTFAYNLGRKHDRKSEVDFTAFLSKLESFAYTANIKLKNLGDFDQFLYPYYFVHLVKHSTQASNFKCSILVGQYIHPDDNCIAENVNFIQRNAQSLMPTFASQSICGIKWLHDRQQTHGHIDPRSFWITKKEGFCLSDAIFMPELLTLCTEFEDATTSATVSKASSPSSPAQKSLRFQMIENQKRDIFNLGTVIDSITMKNNSMAEDQESDFSKTLHAFIRLCQNSKTVEQLVEHKFLSLYFLNMSHINQSTSDGSSIIPFNQFEHSRLAKDFCNFRFLGKGGFGSVLLARNKLDWSDYAIKVISLPSKSDHLIKKVTREVNVLARLHHPNVVRYFAAWIETASFNSPLSSSVKEPLSPPTQSSDSILFQAPAGDANNDSFDTASENSTATSSSSSNSSIKKGFFRKPKSSFSAPRIQTIFSPITAPSVSGINSEFDVIFNDDDEDDAQKLAKVNEDEEELTEEDDITNLSKTLYIQMEYCEANTLKSLIDSGKLYENTELIWKLFRQILNGLQYIHSQNFLHRDLKPGNLFLDANMNIKIGDFGLAVLETFSRNDGEPDAPAIPQDIERTNNVGTGSYIAPEVEKSAVSKESYDSKCDVYSLGIVLFEMFYRPLPNGMERVDIIKSLRNMRTFPDDFGKQLMDYQKENVKELLKGMLALNPKERHAVHDLLDDDRVPFVEDEQADFEKKFGLMLRNRRSAFHQWVLGELFALEVPSSADFLYDKGILTDPKSEEPRHQAIISNISRDLRNIFHLHGICELGTHPLIPYNIEKAALTSSHSAVTVLDRSGYLLMMSTDLRQAFARYCARNALQSVRRFAFGKVATAAESVGQVVSGIHPNERHECAIDFISPIQYASDVGAEIIHLIIELEKHLPVLADLKHTIRIGHSKLIEAICSLNGFHGNMLKMIQASFHSFITKSQKQTTEAKITRLSKDTKLSHQISTVIVRQLEPVESLDELKNRINKLTKTKSPEIRSIASIALEEISQIIDNLVLLCEERKITVVYDPSLSYRPNIFSDGLCYLLQVEFPSTSRRANVLAGGRYDNFLAMQHTSNDEFVPPLCAYGINISLDMLYSFHHFIENPLSAICRVLIYPISKEFKKEATEAVKEFRLKNHSAYIYYGISTSATDILDYCKAYCVPFLLTIADKIKYVVYENVMLTKSSKKAIYGDYSQIALAPEEAIQLICSTDLTHSSKTVVASASNEMISSSSTTVPLTSNPSATTSSRLSGVSFAPFANLSINYAFSTGKPAYNTRKKIENQIQLILQKMLQNFNVKLKVEVFVTEIHAEMLSQLVGTLNRYMNAEDFDRAFQLINAGKQKREMDSLREALRPFFASYSSENPPLILWTRLSENSYKVIM